MNLHGIKSPFESLIKYALNDILALLRIPDRWGFPEVEPGTIEIAVGFSATDIRAADTMTLPCSKKHSNSPLSVEDLQGQVDLALAFAMVHEAPNSTELLTQISSTLKPSGKLLVAEPKIHVTSEQIDETLAIADSLGLKPVEKPTVRHAVSFVFGQAT